MMHGVGSCQLLKNREQLQSSCIGGQRPLNNPKTKENQMHINWEMTCQILQEDLGKTKICIHFFDDISKFTQISTRLKK